MAVNKIRNPINDMYVGKELQQSQSLNDLNTPGSYVFSGFLPTGAPAVMDTYGKLIVTSASRLNMSFTNEGRIAQFLLNPFFGKIYMRAWNPSGGWTNWFRVVTEEIIET